MSTLALARTAARADLAAVEVRLSDKITAASWRVIGAVLGGVGGLLALFRLFA